jgi:hypothetical protein
MSLSGLSNPRTRRSFGLVEFKDLEVLQQRVDKLEKLFQEKKIDFTSEPSGYNGEDNISYTDLFCRDTLYHQAGKDIEHKYIRMVNNLELSLRNEFNMKVASFRKILDEFQEENNALREEVLLLREGLMETLDLLVKHKSRTNLQEPVTTEPI